MLGLPSSVHIYLYEAGTDMRKGVDGLSALVNAHFSADLFSGHLFVFLSTRRDRAKILFWERGGFVVYYKRLERGRFRRPEPNGHGQIQLTPAELSSLLEGIDLSRARRAKLWSPNGEKKDSTGWPDYDVSTPHGEPCRRASVPVA